MGQIPLSSPSTWLRHRWGSGSSPCPNVRDTEPPEPEARSLSQHFCLLLAVCSDPCLPLSLGTQAWLFLLPGPIFSRRLALHAPCLSGCQLRPLPGGSVCTSPSQQCHLVPTIGNCREGVGSRRGQQRDLSARLGEVGLHWGDLASIGFLASYQTGTPTHLSPERNSSWPTAPLSPKAPPSAQSPTLILVPGARGGTRRPG